MSSQDETTANNELQELARKMMEGAYSESVQSKELIRAFILGVERIRSERTSRII